MNADCDVSIIIVNWNTVDLLRDCLDSIYDQTHGITFETIVIDNASSDDSAQMVRKVFPQTTLIENRENRGFAAANNQGLRQAGGRYVLLLNSDTLIQDGAIQKTVHYADRDELVAVVGCQVWENESEIQKTCFRFHTPWNLFCTTTGIARLAPHSAIFGGEKMQSWKRMDEREVDVVSGMFMLVRRAAIEQVGLLDESFFVYCEEADWCYRMKKAGWKNMFWPGARIIHRDGGGKSTQKINVAMEVQLIRSVLIYIRKHYGRTYEALMRLTVFGAASIKLLVFVLMGIILPHRSHGNIAKHFAVARYAVYPAQFRGG